MAAQVFETTHPLIPFALTLTSPILRLRSGQEGRGAFGMGHPGEGNRGSEQMEEEISQALYFDGRSPDYTLPNLNLTFYLIARQK